MKAQVRQTGDSSQVTDGVAHAKALLNDQTLSWPLTVRCDSPTDRALYALLQKAKKWFAVQRDFSYSRVNETRLEAALQRVVTDLPTVIGDKIDTDSRGIMRADTCAITHPRKDWGNGPYINWAFDQSQATNLIDSFNIQMVAAHWRMDVQARAYLPSLSPL